MNFKILNVIVGSRATGLYSPDSDTDYRSVYVKPTSEVLRLNYKQEINTEINENVDYCQYELGHFLSLALKNNPSVLQVMVAPQVGEDVIMYRSNYRSNTESINVTQELRGLFKYVYNPKLAFNSFVGYSSSQQKKMLNFNEKRRNKFACAYISTLYNLIDLLKTGSFKLEVTDTNRFVILKQLRSCDFNSGFVIDIADALIEEAKKLLDKVENKEYNVNSNIDKINDFLLDVRKIYW
jgi:predicted nucleotidyltransferase